MGSEHWSHKVPGGQPVAPPEGRERNPPMPPRRPDPKFAFKLGPLMLELYWIKKVKRAS